MNNKKEFKPYIPPEKKIPELTLSSVVSGIILSIVFGAANAYLGLKVGLTVSASIPAAVIGLGVIRIILKKNSILESNIVQTVGSAGESVAAGAIFTLPTLFLWAREGKIAQPTISEITFIALAGAILGILFMIPLRKALIVKEHHSLPYPEGKACAEVLLSGEKKSDKNSGTSKVFAGILYGGIVKIIADGIKLINTQISFKLSAIRTEIGSQIYPAVISVGYICGPRISSYMLAGGITSWLVIIPLITLFGADTIVYPGTVTIREMYVTGGADKLWSTYIRYIGAGALAAGGIISLIKTLPVIVATVRSTMADFTLKTKSSLIRTDEDIDFKWIIISVIAVYIILTVNPFSPLNFAESAIIVILGFFFSTVSSKMVGLVGSSNNPVSGMSIAALITTTLALSASGKTGIKGMYVSIVIGSVICIISAIAGDCSQDLKTGFLLGATPKKQQIGELIGAVCSALTIGVTLYILDMAWGFGSEELSAPQATLMKLIVEGIFENNLPWSLVISGVFIAVFCELCSVPVLPFAIGVYLPLNLSVCIMIGGVIRLVLEKLKYDKETKTEILNNGTLFCSGLIAGEGLCGVVLAIIAVIGYDKYIDLSQVIPSPLYYGGTIAFLILTVMIIFKASLKISFKNPDH